MAAVNLDGIETGLYAASCRVREILYDATDVVVCDLVIAWALTVGTSRRNKRRDLLLGQRGKQIPGCGFRY